MASLFRPLFVIWIAMVIAAMSTAYHLIRGGRQMLCDECDHVCEPATVVEGLPATWSCPHCHATSLSAHGGLHSDPRGPGAQLVGGEQQSAGCSTRIDRSVSAGSNW